jgi:hypothetical protein
VQARHPLSRHREQAERIVVAQVGLDRERELRQVGERLQVGGMDALGVERLPIVFDVGIGVLQAPLQPLELQRLQLVAAGALDRLELAGSGRLMSCGLLRRDHCPAGEAVRAAAHGRRGGRAGW